MSEKGKEKKLLNALTLILVKRMSKDPAKQKATSLWNKSFAIHTKVGGKDGDVGH